MFGQLSRWISKLISILMPSGTSGTPSPSVPYPQSMSSRSLLIEMLRNEEGVRYEPYKDHLGYWTVGVGHLMDERKGGSLPKWAETEIAATGRLSNESVNKLLENDLFKVMNEIKHNIPWAEDLDDVRYGVLVDMTFQMGIGGVLGFKNTLAHIHAGRYTQAADNMQQSLWYRQTPNRANRRIKEMLTGEYHQYV